jgi:hypothetical protein
MRDSEIVNRGWWFVIRMSGLAVLLMLPLSCRSIVAERLEGPKILGDGSGFVFVYEDLSATSVHIAGDFNRWGPNENGRIKQGDRFNVPFKRRPDGIWEVVVPYRDQVRLPQYDHLDDEIYLDRGSRYSYKLVVNLSEWKLDPSNRSIIRNPADNTENSLLVVP